MDGARGIFFAESSAGHVHEITTAGQFLTVAGNGSPPAGEDAACYAPLANDTLSSPGGIVVDAVGNLYISDTGHHRILRRTVDGMIATIAGTGVDGQTGDGGPAVQAQISQPTAIAVKPDGSIYFLSNYKMRRIRTDGIIESPPSPGEVQWLAFGFDGLLILSGSELYKEAADGLFYGLRGGAGEVAADPTGGDLRSVKPAASAIAELQYRFRYSHVSANTDQPIAARPGQRFGQKPLPIGGQFRLANRPCHAFRAG